MKNETEELIKSLQDPKTKEPFKSSDKLSHIGGEFVLNQMISLLNDDTEEIQYLAARTLSLMKNNESALNPLIDAINDKKNKGKNAGLAEALTEFDCSKKFVAIFKLYLFSSFKVKAMAKMILDYTEFEIKPRDIRKAEKHWKHYSNNVKKDEVYELEKEEIEELLDELKSLFD